MASRSSKEETSSSSDDEPVLSPCTNSCIKLELAENFAAYLEKRELNREIKPIDCHKEVIENVGNNYVIVKNIINYLPWQDKAICKGVCSMWNSVVQTLSKEQLCPVDFSMNLTISARRKGYHFKRSGDFYTEPMAVFVFGNSPAIGEFTSGKCELIVPHPCSPPCDKEHCILDVFYKKIAAPKSCMLVTKAINLAYMPLRDTSTYENALTRVLRASDPYYLGVYMPMIPGVEFKILNLKTLRDSPDYIKKLKELTKSYVIKGALAYLTDTYTLEHQQESIIDNCLCHFRTLQPETPFAFGGCLIEDTIASKDNMDSVMDSISNETEFISGNQLSLGLFLVPKDEELKTNFEVYSAVIESNVWNKDKILQSIRGFALRIPRFEHSIAFKLSCCGRHSKHEIEQNYFHSLFPNTRIVGCFGNGELGVNFPPKTVKPTKETKKRVKVEMEYEIVHAYSTVFMYVGWGKKIAEAECDAKE